MADFNIAVKKTLVNEGGYVDNPSDPGGETKYGISKKQFPNIEIRSLTEDQAATIYQQKYWNPLYAEILDQAVCDKLFDMGVLFGIEEAVEMLQLTLTLDDDGRFGPVTLHYTNQAVSVTLLKAYQTTLVSHVLGIGANKPELRQFVGGWIRRINN